MLQTKILNSKMKPRNTEIDKLLHNGLGELVVKLTNEDDAKTVREKLEE